jgi:hypothetical protein
MPIAPQQYLVEKNGYFPGSKFPVLHYKENLQLPTFFPGQYVRSVFQETTGPITGVAAFILFIIITVLHTK